MNKLQKENLQKLSEWFENHHIAIVMDDRPGRVRIVTVSTDVHKIAVCVCAPEDEDEMFHRLRECDYLPFFIREDDTWEFTHKKIRNCTRGWNTAKVRKVEMEEKRKAEKAALEAARPKPRRKRVRIAPHHYEKVGGGRR